MDMIKFLGLDVLFLQLPLQPTIILCSAKAAFDLMNRRSNIYLDKPQVLMDELTGWGNWALGMLPYGVKWRNTCQCFHQYFNQGIIHQYHPVEVREVRAFLRRVIDDIGEINAQSISQTFVGIILDIVYGMPVNSMNDNYIHLVRHSIEGFSQSRVPGAFWAESIPILKYIPSWVPGASATNFGAQYKPFVNEMRDWPFHTVRDNSVSSTLHLPKLRVLTFA
ncbi:hypothetical protein PHLCEN_2v7122 [Hermanssonia centrifuga]|uniref:Cytochrome P450 n=1 Tax=Hermanssonia centrifuga TaxID=98765 RepID=A0A2R6NXF5_9APHY|nr:hypothetical protein PHLCEN_2v7122 [Hermanssonia centrifuga]